MTSFINDSGAEIYSGEDILITKQVASFKNFKIKGDVSVSFTVPNTSKNRKTLGYYGLNQVGGPVFSINTFNCVKDGNVIMRGNLVIESDNGKDLGLYFISGNANWFRLFEFSCKDIRNDSLAVSWSYYWNDATKANTSGIVFPAIDLMYEGYKYTSATFNGRIIDSSFAFDGLYNPVNNTPCLYMNTLIVELGKIAGVRIDGTLMDDPLYKALIITPEGPDLYNDLGQISTFRVTANVDYVGYAPENLTIYIQNIAPNIKAIEVIKWLCVSFGCVPVFDEYSQTLYLNIIDKFRKEDSEDWSEYFKGYTIRYDQYQNNWIRVNSTDDPHINFYNEFNQDSQSQKIPFGEANLLSNKVDESSHDVYASPFLPSFHLSGSNILAPLAWETPLVQFYKLEDDGAIEFTSVTNFGGKAVFTCASVDIDIPLVTGTLVIWVNDGVYKGFHNIETITATELYSTSDYSVNSTGTLYVQKVNKVNSGPRILVAIPNLAVSSFTGNSAFNVPTFGNVTNATYAYYHKYSSTINDYKLGLSYGHIKTITRVDGNTSGPENDIPLEERYLQPIKKMIEGPTTEAKMLLPESVFDNYNFDKFVYIKNQDFQGYFFVDSIQNYKDGKTLVRVDLLTV